jgi:hypothetical protein
MPLQTYTWHKSAYTVDYRLKQFRRIKRNGEIEFVSFYEDKGDRILTSMIKQRAADWSRLHL